MSRTERVDDIYDLAGIAMEEKYRKVKLATSIWNVTNSNGEDVVIMKPENSTHIFSSLFPEITKTSNLNPIMPSRKGLERFGIEHRTNEIPIPLSLEGTPMHFCYNLDSQLISNLAEISRCFVTGVKHLALSGSLSSERLEVGLEKILLQQSRQLDAIDSPKYLLIHQFVNNKHIR